MQTNDMMDRAEVLTRPYYSEMTRHCAIFIVIYGAYLLFLAGDDVPRGLHLVSAAIGCFVYAGFVWGCNAVNWPFPNGNPATANLLRATLPWRLLPTIAFFGGVQLLGMLAHQVAFGTWTSDAGAFRALSVAVTVAGMQVLLWQFHNNPKWTLPRFTRSNDANRSDDTNVEDTQ